jgi:uncharacterized membrane protein
MTYRNVVTASALSVVTKRSLKRGNEYSVQLKLHMKIICIIIIIIIIIIVIIIIITAICFVVPTLLKTWLLILNWLCYLEHFKNKI